MCFKHFFWQRGTRPEVEQVNHPETQSKLYYNQPTNVLLNRFFCRYFDGILITLKNEETGCSDI
jgi:hypothetical protein